MRHILLLGVVRETNCSSVRWRLEWSRRRYATNSKNIGQRLRHILGIL